MILLRPYQDDSVASVIAEVMAANDPLLVAPTGRGKTVIAAAIIQALGDHKFVLIIAHRRELIRQIKKKLADFDIRAGVILAGMPLDATCRVQVASIQTLSARYIRGRKDLPPASLIFIDEAHHARARTYRKLVEMYPDARVAGLTATPCRRDGRGLGGTFNVMVEAPQVEELIKLGFLVATKVYAPSTPNLKGIHTRQGDYVEKELDRRVNTNELVGDIVTHWLRLNVERRRTVVFATSVAHSIHICEELTKAGVRAAHIDGGTDKAERDEILAKLDRGELEVVCNCMILTEGWDQPSVGCIVLARPTKSMGLYRQMVGRGLRPFEGKDHLLLIDHAGATFEHGFVEDPVEWTLDPDKKAETPKHKARNKGELASQLLACTKCSAIRTAGRPCPECGHLPKRPGEHVSVIDGELHRLDRDGQQHPNQYSIEDRQTFYRGLVAITFARGHKVGAAAYRYKERFGEFPPHHWITLGPRQVLDRTAHAVRRVVEHNVVGRRRERKIRLGVVVRSLEMHDPM